jgi:ABC-type transporter Mla subunit MlaD
MMNQNEAFNALREDIKTGFGLLIDQARLTNEKIDLTNEGVDQTNQRLDQTNQRLDQTIIELKDFKVEVSTKLDGIGAYLRSINGSSKPFRPPL